MGNSIHGNVKKDNKLTRKTSNDVLTEREAPSSSRKNLPSNFSSQQQQRKHSTWSLGSLNERLNWSFLNTSRSFHSLSKVGSKSYRKQHLQSVQQNSKTNWPIPLTDNVFLPHFKRVASKQDNYVIDNVIANGAFGIVFKVHDKHNANLIFALKVLKKSKIIEENSVRQIKEEIEIQRVCGHYPFIVKQLGSWQDRTTLKILLEYICCGELFATIRNFPYELAKLYTAEIALAIEFLHNAGIIFRDVKSENILLTSSYHIKLTDFGLSKWLKFGERTRTMCGTLQYMAPEILKGEPYGHTADWWSIGVVACRMLTNAFPNSDILIEECVTAALNSMDSNNGKESAALAIESHSQNEIRTVLPDAVETIQKDAKDLLVRLLERNPKYRLHSVLELKRIAFFKDYNLDVDFLLQVPTSEMIERAEINEAPDQTPNREKFEGF